jgi:hypothetical protein
MDESILNMANPNSFAGYYRRFLGRLIKDSYEWPRDNGLIAGGMAVLPLLLTFLRDRTIPVDWNLIWTTLSLYAVLIVSYLAIQTVRTAWRLDSDRAKEVQTAHDADLASNAIIAGITLEHSSERPLLGLNVHSVRGETIWRTTGAPVAFTIQHLGGRIPTSIRFDSVPSKLGAFSLQFDAVPHADPAPHQTGVGFEVAQIGAPQLSARDWATTQQYQGELLRLFVCDSPADMKEIRYELIAHFKDGNDEREQTFHLVFDMHRFCFSPNTV